MAWIITNGVIKDVDGDGIRVEDPRGGGVISGMHISRAKGSGIVIGGGAAREERPELRLSSLLDLLESRLHELPQEKQASAQALIEGIRQNPTTVETHRGFKLLYDIAVDVAGSSISKILAALVGGS